MTSGGQFYDWRFNTLYPFIVSTFIIWNVNKIKHKKDIIIDSIAIKEHIFFKESARRVLIVFDCQKSKDTGTFEIVDANFEL